MPHRPLLSKDTDCINAVRALYSIVGIYWILIEKKSFGVWSALHDRSTDEFKRDIE